MGIQNVLIFSVDGLNGFKEAIVATFPFAKIQRCIIHQITSSMKYIPYKDMKALTYEQLFVLSILFFWIMHTFHHDYNGN